MSDWTPCAQHAKGWQDATVPDDECTKFLRSVGFQPTPKQYDFITCPADDVGFGGARGGAKSHAILGDWLWCDHQYGTSAVGLVIRRELIQLNEFIERTKVVFDRANAMIRSTDTKAPKWTWHAQQKTFEGPNGSRLRFAYLDVDADADKYMGHEYIRVYVEERGNFPRAQPLNKLRATLRSSTGVRCQMKSTFNPGGVGHQHCQSDYRLTDKIPKGYEIFKTAEGLTRIFIPSKLRDNPHLGDDYLTQLRAACAGNEALLQAWLDGAWDLIEGAFFNSWSGQHVIPPFDIPNDWLRFRSVRWGSARPLSVGWWAVASSDFTTTAVPEMAEYGNDARVHSAQRDFAERPIGNGASAEHGQRVDRAVSAVSIPRGSLIRYREWYAQKSTASNEGLKLTAEQIAAGIVERTPKDEKITYTVVSPQAFDSRGGPSIAERLIRGGVPVIPADNHSSKDLGHSAGWDQMRARLVGREGVPAIYCFTNCQDSVRTIPALQHDRDHPEEIDDESEINCADDWRFACMSRPWSVEAPKPVTPKFITVGGDSTVTMDDLWKAREQRVSRRF